MRTAIEAIEVVSDLGRPETIYRVRIFEVKRDANPLQEVELPSRYATASGDDLSYSDGIFTTPHRRRRYYAAVSSTG